MKTSYEKFPTPDQIWKLLITKFFGEFLSVVRPSLLKDIVIEKTEFLEKELISLTGKKKIGIVDVLAKVYLKNGGNEYLLFHTEVQGKKEKYFPERMFAYYIRIWDKYRKNVVSVALMTENNSFSKGQNKLVLKSYGTSQIFKYTLIDISHFDYYECIRSKNPVRIVISLLSSNCLYPKWKKKAEIMQRLIELGLDQDKINILFAFVECLKPLNNEEIKKFDSYIERKYKGETPMVLTSFERKGMKKGLQKGLRKGIQLGIQKGKLEGRQEGVEKVILRMASRKYAIKEISEITGEPIEAVKKVINSQE